VDQERLVHLKGEELRIGIGYIKLAGSTVHLTAKEFSMLCAIFDARLGGITIAEIGTQLEAQSSNDLSSLVTSYVHTTNKKLAALSDGQITIKWNRKDNIYYLAVL
jgi:DNA-binding response OmpR family regulator